MPKASDAVPESTAQLAARLARNAVDCLPSGGLSAKLSEAESQGRRLRVRLDLNPFFDKRTRIVVSERSHDHRMARYSEIGVISRSVPV